MAGHPAGLERLSLALDAFAADPVPLRRGDALDLLPGLLCEIPLGVVPVVFHAWVLYQFTTEARQRLDSLLAAGASQRGSSVYRISMESAREGASAISLVEYTGRRQLRTVLATAPSHGAWLDWRPSLQSVE